jgi:transcription antitermination factor NusG
LAEALRPASVSADAAEKRWYACWTRSRHEKRVSRMLEERGVETFLPLVPRQQQWRDRRRIVDFPLFPSYVFSRFSLDESARILSIPGVAGLVRSNGQPAAIPEDELDNVRRFAALLRNGGLAAEPCAYFAQGVEVEVLAGPFAGLRGVVTEHRGRRRVVVGLRAIGQGMVLDIETRLLKVAGQESGCGT